MPVLRTQTSRGDRAEGNSRTHQVNKEGEKQNSAVRDVAKLHVYNGTANKSLRTACILPLEGFAGAGRLTQEEAVRVH